MGTKAETLLRLQGRLCSAKVLPQFHFTVEQWEKRSTQLLAQMEQMGWMKIPLVVRSSSLSEDTSEGSMAGAFLSILNVLGRQSTALAIEDVVDSFYKHDPERKEKLHQVLVQPMLRNVVAHGVMTTRVLGDGAPYYLVNFDDESGETDRVTGGVGVNKTVLIHHEAKSTMFKNPMVLRWKDLAVELEGIFHGIPLDIEFAETSGEGLFLLQVRPIAAAKNWDLRKENELHKLHSESLEHYREISKRRKGVCGERAIFGVMPDWNPAEIIGTVPRPLATSLYRYLVTDRTWREAREQMGYYHPPGEPLLFEFGARPYINVRNSFNSYLPSSLTESLREKLVNAWLERLAANPHLHDKVEFDVATTVLEFDFEQIQRQRYPGLLTESELNAFREGLRKLTNDCLDASERGTLHKAMSEVGRLIARQEEEVEVSLERVLQRCRDLGTLPFSILARHGFIAETLLRSAVRQGALTKERLIEFKNTVETVSGELSRDFRRAFQDIGYRNIFLKKYGHLRPGTYDLLSLRYDQREDLFESCQLPPDHAALDPFELTEGETQCLEALLCKAGLCISSTQLFQYARTAIEWRERAKFVFTRDLSKALEMIAVWGEERGLSREKLSFLRLETILGAKEDCNPEIERHQLLDQVSKTLRLGFLICDERDFYVIPLQRGAPNFVTNKRFEGPTVKLDSKGKSDTDLKGKVVCIENADPGFDWIFTRGIAGLITKYGGSNSHMAIRCAEFGLPAAIGCGEQTFERIVSMGDVFLDCATSTLRPRFQAR